MLILLIACTGAAPPLEARPRPPESAPAPLPLHTVYPTTRAAVDHVLASRPRVLGVGEVHAKTDGPEVPTTIGRFTRDVLPALGGATDLVLETWRVDGSCGEQEEQVVAKVEQDTKRPVETKSEIVVLAEAAQAMGIRPHDLAISCAEYDGLLGEDGEVAYGALLRLLTAKLQEYAIRGLEAPDATIVLYGGAVHNDLFPKAELADYSYGVAARTKGGPAYVELDLYAPEQVRGNDSLLDPAWAPILDKAGPDHVVLVERGPGSWVLVLPSVAAP